MDAITAVGAAFYNFMHEDDVIFMLTHGDVVIDDTGELMFELEQLVVVSGEERFGFDGRAVVQVFDDGPCDGEAVVGGGTAANFVKNDEAARGGVIEDVGGFGHFDHEGGLAAGELITGADAGKDAVNNADFGGGGGDEAAHLRHEDEEGILADIGGFAGHIGPGEDHDLGIGSIEEGVVGDELLVREEALDDGMAACGDVEGVTRGDEGAAVIAAQGDPGEVLQHIKGGDGSGEVLERGVVGGDVEAQFLKEFVFKLAGAFIGVEDAGLHFFKFGSDETLAGGDGLFADVIGRYKMEIGFGDFDVVAEDFVVADFEGFDAGAVGFGELELSDPIFAVRGEGAELVEFSIVAGLDDAALLEFQRRVVYEGADEEIKELGGGNQAGGELAKEGAGGILVMQFGGGERERSGGAVSAESFGERAEMRHSLERGAQGGEIARGAVAGAEAAGKAFDVADGAEDVLQAGDEFLRLHEGFDGILAGADGRDVEEGCSDPVAEHAGAHGGRGIIEDTEQRAVGGSIAEGMREFKIAARDVVEDHVMFAMKDTQGADVFEASIGEILAYIAERGASRGYGAGHLFAAKTVEGDDAKMLQQGIAAVIKIHLVERDGEGVAEQIGIPRIEGSVWRQKHLARLDAHEFLAQGIIAADFTEFERAGGDIQDSDADAGGRRAGLGGGERIECSEEIVAGVRELAFVEGGAGGDDAGYGAFDDAFGGARVFDLVADSDAAIVAQEAADVDLGGVIRDAAHGHIFTFLGAAASEREIQQFSGFDGIVVEHLIEIAEAEHEDGMGMLLFDGLILAHHGSEFITGRHRQSYSERMVVTNPRSFSVEASLAASA